jgi:hypothetical protein
MAHIHPPNQTKPQTQYVAAFRKLVHLPIVVLATDSDKFAVLLQGVRQRLRQSCRLGRHLIPPDTRDMYFVKGSPKNKVDLIHCCVESAYAVVLLGDNIPRKKEAGLDTDPVLQVRHTRRRTGGSKACADHRPFFLSPTHRTATSSCRASSSRASCNSASTPRYRISSNRHT